MWLLIELDFVIVYFYYYCCCYSITTLIILGTLILASGVVVTGGGGGGGGVSTGVLHVLIFALADLFFLLFLVKVTVEAGSCGGVWSC